MHFIMRFEPRFGACEDLKGNALPNGVFSNTGTKSRVKLQMDTTLKVRAAGQGNSQSENCFPPKVCRQLFTTIRTSHFTQKNNFNPLTYTVLLILNNKFFALSLFVILGSTKNTKPGTRSGKNCRLHLVSSLQC